MTTNATSSRTARSLSAFMIACVMTTALPAGAFLFSTDEAQAQAAGGGGGGRGGAGGGGGKGGRGGSDASGGKGSKSSGGGRGGRGDGGSGGGNGGSSSDGISKKARPIVTCIPGGACRPLDKAPPPPPQRDPPDRTPPQTQPDPRQPLVLDSNGETCRVQVCDYYGNTNQTMCRIVIEEKQKCRRLEQQS